MTLCERIMWRLVYGPLFRAAMRHMNAATPGWMKQR